MEVCLGLPMQMIVFIICGAREGYMLHIHNLLQMYALLARLNKQKEQLATR